MADFFEHEDGDPGPKFSHPDWSVWREREYLESLASWDNPNFNFDFCQADYEDGESSIDGEVGRTIFISPDLPVKLTLAKTSVICPPPPPLIEPIEDYKPPMIEDMIYTAKSKVTAKVRESQKNCENEAKLQELREEALSNNVQDRFDNDLVLVNTIINDIAKTHENVNFQAADLAAIFKDKSRSFNADEASENTEEKVENEIKYRTEDLGDQLELEEKVGLVRMDGRRGGRLTTPVQDLVRQQVLARMRREKKSLRNTEEKGSEALSSLSKRQAKPEVKMTKLNLSHDQLRYLLDGNSVPLSKLKFGESLRNRKKKWVPLWSRPPFKDPVQETRRLKALQAKVKHDRNRYATERMRVENIELKEENKNMKGEIMDLKNKVNDLIEELTRREALEKRLQELTDEVTSRRKRETEMNRKITELLNMKQILHSDQVDRLESSFVDK